MKLNIGCGNDLKQGWVNLDIANPKVEVNHDLNNFPYPFRNNTFDTILASHILEDLIPIEEVMKELRRILKTDGILIVKYPHYTSKWAYFNPFHAHFWNEDTFDYFCREGEYGNRNTGFRMVKKEKHRNTLRFWKIWEVEVHLMKVGK